MCLLPELFLHSPLQVREARSIVIGNNAIYLHQRHNLHSVY